MLMELSRLRGCCRANLRSSAADRVVWTGPAVRCRAASHCPDWRHPHVVQRHDSPRALGVATRRSFTTPKHKRWNWWSSTPTAHVQRFPHTSLYYDTN